MRLTGDVVQDTEIKHKPCSLLHKIQDFRKCEYDFQRWCGQRLIRRGSNTGSYSGWTQPFFPGLMVHWWVFPQLFVLGVVAGMEGVLRVDCGYMRHLLSNDAYTLPNLFFVKNIIHRVIAKLHPSPPRMEAG